jgi:signal transduction histidine kinase
VTSAAAERANAPVASARPATSRTALDRAIAISLGAFAVIDAFVLSRQPLVPVDPVPILLALGAACVAVLTRASAPTIAWLATIVGAFAGSAVAIAQSRAADPAAMTLASWLGWAAPAGVGAFVAIAVALGYATRRDHPVPALAIAFARTLVAWLAIAIVVTLVAAAAGGRSDPAITWEDFATLPISRFVPFVVIVTAIGALADIRRGVHRARDRIGPAVPGESSARRAWALAIATANELIPGQTAAARATIEAERVRLAGDLHASVLPQLRRAIADAESGGDPDALARHLRSVDLELERVMAERWPIVLESFGLVTALEDLAERLEADGAPPITIEVERVEGRPPAAVERTAWRFAQVALDNAVRHAAATTISVNVSIDPVLVRLVIADDGRGLDSASGARPAARGLADAARRAAEIGASTGVAGRANGGTEASFEWVARPPT